MKLQGKVALITGGGGAMGGAQARLFAREGAAVCVTDLFMEKAEAVAKEIEAAGGRAIAVPLDVQRADQWAAAVAATEGAFGPVSILCNNAGANCPRRFRRADGGDVAPDRRHDPHRLVPRYQSGRSLDAPRGRRRDRQSRLARLDPARWRAAPATARRRWVSSA